jgi:hypothetical protein
MTSATRESALPPADAISPALRARVRAIRRRAVVDAAAVIIVTLAVSMPVSNPADSLAVGMAAVSVGMLLFMLRRRNDFTVLAQAARLRERAVAGRGLTVAQWAAGAPLPPWTEREAAEPADAQA